MEVDKSKIGKKALFSDVDGTLAFYEGLHGFELVRASGNKMVEVVRTGEPKTYRGYWISGQQPGQNIFVDQKTRDLCLQLAECYDLFLVTGAGEASLRRRAPLLDFPQGYVAENGGLVMDKNFQEDKEWNERIAQQVAYLSEISHYLKKQGWVLDTGRKTSIRLRLEKNPKKTEGDFEHISHDIRKVHRQHGLKVTLNLGYLDIIPKYAGKGNAIDHIVRKNGYDPRKTVGIGDDINDLSLLEHVAEGHVLRSGHSDLIEVAAQHEWHVSRFTYVNGINEILGRLLRQS